MTEVLTISKRQLEDRVQMLEQTVKELRKASEKTQEQSNQMAGMLE